MSQNSINNMFLSMQYEQFDVNNSLSAYFMSREEISEDLGKVEHNFEQNEAGEFTSHMNDYVLNLEHELRRAVFLCNHNACQHNPEYCEPEVCKNREEDFKHWLFATIRVMIDDSYEFHGRVIGAHKQREFRLKYYTNVSKDCKMYDICNTFAQLLNEMHVKLNHKFITKYEFLKPMEKIREEMEKTEYNPDKVITNLYTFIERVYVNDSEEYDNICLTFFQNISVEEYIRRWSHIPYGDYNFFKKRDYSQYFDDSDYIKDYANELCFSKKQLYPSDADEPQYRLSYYPRGHYKLLLDMYYTKDRKKVLADNNFRFESLYDTDPLSLEGPSSVENSVNGFDEDIEMSDE
jgi:hypothetical protein